MSRYRVVALRAGARLPRRLGDFDVVGRVDGNATTDFGAPGAVSAHDRNALTRGEARRFARLVDAAWARLDDVAAFRASVATFLSQPSDGSAPKRWPPRCAAHRIDWHALDHAWEIEDRSEDLSR